MQTFLAIMSASFINAFSQIFRSFFIFGESLKAASEA